MAEDIIIVFFILHIVLSGLFKVNGRFFFSIFRCRQKKTLSESNTITHQKPSVRTGQGYNLQHISLVYPDEMKSIVIFYSILSTLGSRWSKQNKHQVYIPSCDYNAYDLNTLWWFSLFLTTPDCRLCWIVVTSHFVVLRNVYLGGNLLWSI